MFNKELKKEGINYFNIEAGYKLNIQKKIIISNNKPLKLIDEDGKYINIIENYNDTSKTIPNNVYTFEDESKRILRIISNGYEIENEDFSKEMYNTNGNITNIYDKYNDLYLSYTYNSNNYLTSITFNNNKTINFLYTNNIISSITYSNVSISLTYNSSNIEVNHYTGISYSMQYSNTKYNVKGYKTLNQSIIYQEKEIEFSSKDITLKKKIDEQIVDTLTYTYQFDVTTNEYKKSDIIDVTDYNGVKQRIHYSNTKPLYSYEINNNNEVTFINGKYNNTIKLYDVLNELKYALFIGELKENDGIPMMYSPTIANPNHWTKDISLSGYSSDKGYYLLTGWYKSSSMNTQKIINISNNTAGSIYSFFVPIVNYGEWTFFAYQFSLRASFIYVYPETVTDELKDVRLTFQETHIIDENDNSHTLFQESILVDSNNNKISFNDVSFQYETNNNESDIINVTSSDLLRYIKRKIKTNQASEIYYNNGKNIINNVSSFKVILSDNTIKDVNQFNVGYRHYKNNKLYDTIIEKSTSNTININNYENNISYGYQLLNSYFDVTKKEEDNITTSYTKNKGLITREKVQDKNNNVLSNITYTYNTSNNTIVVKDLSSSSNSYLYTGITYHIDPIWGVITKEVKKNNIITENIYDDVKNVIQEKKFYKQQQEAIKHSYGYTKGNITSIINDTLTYNFEYSKGKIIKVKKNDNIIEEQTHTDTKDIIYYPNKTNSNYIEEYVYDKYNRIKEITGEIENIYNIYSTSEETGEIYNEIDNISSKLIIQKDNKVNEETRYYYNKDDFLEKTITSLSSSFSNKPREENITYDEAKRIKDKTFKYNIGTSNERTVKDEIIYLKDEYSPIVDEVIKENKYYINDNVLLTTSNTYDTANRITKKEYTINNKTYTKELQINNNKITKETNVYGSSNQKEIRYTYDEYERISSITKDNKQITYEYDEYGRIQRENNENLDKTIVYEYNDIGNILNKKTYSYTTGELSNVINTKIYTYDNTYKDRLINYNGTSISYNNIGCITTYKGYELTYNKGRLTNLFKGTLQEGSQSYNYTYNGNGQRIKKTYIKTHGTGTIGPVYVGELKDYTKIYTYDNTGRIIRETNNYNYYDESTSNEIIEYLYDVNIVKGIRYTKGNTSRIYYLERNILGDVIEIYDTNGNIQVKYKYDGYGNCTIESDISEVSIGTKNPIRYRGYYYDEETNLFLVSSRYYSPELCRWISPDDIEYLDPESVNGLNLYCYCANDPINHIDPDGHAWYHWAIGAGIIVACAALTVITAGGFAAAGAAFASVVTATMAPTALSAVFAGATIGAAAIGVAGAVIGGKTDENGFSWDNDWSWENSSKGFMIGSIAGAVIGGAWGGAHYALQSAGKMAIRTNINNLVNNPLDEFVTVGPKDGGISSYVRSINATGDYGKIYASKLQNGLYQIANGHHRVAALRQLGYRYVNFFLVP